MKYLYFCFFFAILIVRQANAQIDAFKWREERGYKYIGVNGSISRYYGDLSEEYNLSHLQLAWAIGAHFRYRLGSHLCLRSDVGVYRIRGEQQYTRNKVNNLSFVATNLSINVGAQWDLLAVDANLRNIVYVFGGPGITKISPSTILDGVTYTLPTYKTEGKVYSRWAAQLHYGIGLPMSLGRFTQICVEARYTHVMSDYLDDVSTLYVNKTDASILEKRLADKRIDASLPINAEGAQRGNPAWKDGYFLLTLQLIYKFE